MNITRLDKLTLSSRTHFSVSLTRALTLSSTPQLGISICPLAYFHIQYHVFYCSLFNKLMLCMKIMLIRHRSKVFSLKRFFLSPESLVFKENLDGIVLMREILNKISMVSRWDCLKSISLILMCGPQAISSIPVSDLYYIDTDCLVWFIATFWIHFQFQLESFFVFSFQAEPQSELMIVVFHVPKIPPNVTKLCMEGGWGFRKDHL